MERVIIIQQQQGFAAASKLQIIIKPPHPHPTRPPLLSFYNNNNNNNNNNQRRLSSYSSILLRNGWWSSSRTLLLRRRPPPPPRSISSSNEPIISSSSSSSLLSENDNNNNEYYGSSSSFSSSNTNTKALALGTVALLSTILLTVIHPIIAPPAFATFQTVAAKAGAPLRTELLTSAWTGFFAGCLHTLSGPDHLAALAPLSIGRTRMESAAVGALWGCGHDAGQVIFGLLFLVLKDRLHIEIIRTWGTRVVGLTLLVIGAMGIKEAREAATTPCVVLENGECDVSGTYEDMDSPTVVKKKKIGFATFATGVVHGLQPDALMMVLPALALPSRLAGAAFLGMFLVGTVISMGSYTVFIGSCSQALKERVPRITEKLTWASSLVAIAFGLAIIISQYFGFNLY